MYHAIGINIKMGIPLTHRNRLRDTYWIHSMPQNQAKKQVRAPRSGLIQTGNLQANPQHIRTHLLSTSVRLTPLPVTASRLLQLPQARTGTTLVNLCPRRHLLTTAAAQIKRLPKSRPQPVVKAPVQANPRDVSDEQALSPPVTKAIAAIVP